MLVSREVSGQYTTRQSKQNMTITSNDQHMVPDEEAGWILVVSKKVAKASKQRIGSSGPETTHDVRTAVNNLAKGHLPPAIDERAAEVLNLKDHHFSCDSPGWRPWPAPTSLREAHRVLEFASVKPLSEPQAAAKSRLIQLYDSFAAIGRDFVYEAFLDLDEVLFQGTLRHRVYIEWSDAPRTTRNSIAFVTRPSISPLGLPRTTIHLDSKWAWLGGAPDNRWCYSRQRVWGSLIHEMLHCFLQIMVARPYGLDLADQEVCHCHAKVFHGPLWIATVGRLATRLRFSDLEASDIDCFQGKCHRWNNKAEQAKNETESQTA